MSGVQPRYQNGPRTFPVAAAIVGGQLVIPDVTNHFNVNVAGAAATNVIGVALEDGAPAGTDPATYVFAREATIPVACGVQVLVTYAANSNTGDRLKAAANGQVTPMILGTDAPHLCVGTNTDPAGSVLAAATGLALIEPFGM
jgi:hypothetical protein